MIAVEPETKPSTTALPIPFAPPVTRTIGFESVISQPSPSSRRWRWGPRHRRRSDPPPRKAPPPAPATRTPPPLAPTDLSASPNPPQGPPPDAPPDPPGTPPPDTPTRPHTNAPTAPTPHHYPRRPGLWALAARRPRAAT